MTGMLTPEQLAADPRFYFDEAAADRVCRFVEKFIVFPTGPRRGEPFRLEPIQLRIIRDVFGWKWRHDPAIEMLAHKRRFRDVYWDGAIGCGKSPLLAIIGLYGLVGDGEAGAELYSLASKYAQAKIVFESAKAFVGSSKPLSKVVDVVEREIRYRATRSRWTVVSGKGPGAGAKPSMILADEVHDFANSRAYDDLNDRKVKREQPLMIAATNAGLSRASFCWRLREKAVAALEQRGDPAVYPIIWAADETDATDDPAAWRKANPLLGVTLKEIDVAAKCREMMKNEDQTAEFRRLYLGIWPKTGAGRWLDLSIWDDVTANFNAAKRFADAPLYVGLDLAQSDDLCSAVYGWLTPSKLYVGSHFWIPRATAQRYESSDAVPYSAWEAAGAITLVDSPTISSAVRRAIANDIIAKSKTAQLKAVCYDPWKADETIAVLEAAGLPCVPIKQGFNLNAGCQELDRRLKERAIVVADNPVMRFCAENVCLTRGVRDDVYPVKPEANVRTGNAGDRHLKIDGIAALVTLTTESRKHAFPAAAKEWKGTVCLL